MTAITKAQNKLDEFKAGLNGKVSDSVQNGIEALNELIDLFTYRKRKADKVDLKPLYDWFDDEFTVRFEMVAVKVKG